MAKFIPVNKAEHAGKAWRRPAHYGFVATEPTIPLVSVEFAKAAVSMPIAFVAQEGRYVPVAMTSPIAGRNMFIGPSGQWLGTYMPAALAAYPFRLARVEGKLELVLCIDQDSIAPDGIGQSFFDPDGSPSAAIKAVLDLLKPVEGGRTLTETAVAALAEAGVIQPWSLNISIDGQPADRRPTPLKDLYRIDETALNALDDEAFLKLRKASALPLAYLQILSMGQTSLFPQLMSLYKRLAPTQQQQQASVPKLPPNLLDEFFAAAENETVRFK